MAQFHPWLLGDGGTRSFQKIANLHQVSVHRIWREAPSQVLHFPLLRVPPSFPGTQGPGSTQVVHQLPQQCTQCMESDVHLFESVFLLIPYQAVFHSVPFSSASSATVFSSAVALASSICSFSCFSSNS